MATVIDLLRHLGQQRAPDGANALAGPVVLPGISDGTLSLPLPPMLIRAWQQATGRHTVGHHALALSTQQAGHDVALMGHGSAPFRDLVLLVFGQLRPNETTLWIAPRWEEQDRALLTSLASQLGVKIVDAGAAGARIAPAHLVLATPDDVHGRVLRYHDRAWRWLWPRLQCVALPHLDAATGIAGAHLHWLLRRVERLASEPPLQFLAALTPVADAEHSLKRMFDRPVRVIAAPDGPAFDTLIALWRCGHDREAALLDLATQLTARKLAITLYGRTERETSQLRAAAAATLGELDPQARVALVAGVPSSAAERQHLLRLGYRLLIFLAGPEPHEQLIATQPTLMLQSLPHWPFGASNPYVVSEELACAATERPIELGEIDRWHVRELRDRLVKKQVLQALPGGELWQSAPDAADPYRKLDMSAIGGHGMTVVDNKSVVVERVSATLAQRNGLVNSRWTAGWRVARRDDGASKLHLEPDPRERDTIVLADMTIAVREELAARSIHINKLTIGLTRGKVVAAQRIVGLRELVLNQPPTDHRIHGSDTTQWSAAACWIALPEPPGDVRSAGWALAQALPFVALAHPRQIVPSYDAGQHRLYLIEAEPGGTGLIDGLYDRFERWLDLANDLAEACSDHPLYHAIAGYERRWIAAFRTTAAETGGDSVTAETSSPPPIDPTAPPVPVAQPTAARTEKAARIYPAPARAAATEPPARMPRILPFPKPASPPIDRGAASSRDDAAPADSAQAPSEQDEHQTSKAAVGAERPTPRRAIELPPPTPLFRAAEPADDHDVDDVADDADLTADEEPAAADPSEWQRAPGDQPRQPLAATEPRHIESEPGQADDQGSEQDAPADQEVPDMAPPDPLSAKRQFTFEELLPPLPDEQSELTDGDVEDADAAREPTGTGNAERRRQHDDAMRRRRGTQRARQPEPRRPQQPRQPRWDRNEAHGVDRARSDSAGRDTSTLPPRTGRLGASELPRATQGHERPRSDRPAARAERAPEPAVPAPEPQADVGAMIARMRQLRQQREAEQRQSPAPAPPPKPSQPAELRFHIGERVQCLPYGTGVVRASKLVDGRELVLLDFPDFGELEVDPAVSLLRRVDDPATRGDDDDL